MEKSKLKTKIGLKRILSGILTFMLVFTSMIFTGLTTFAATERQIDGGSSEDLIKVIKKAKNGDSILINGTVIIDKEIKIKKKTITLKGNGILLRNVDFNGIMLNLDSKANVTMEGISIEGNFVEKCKEPAVCINKNASFTMNGGTIRNNNNCYGEGGGVCNRGTFTMNGGTISKNNANTNGGVYNAGTFRMTGGTISENTATSGGGVYNTGTFTMNGGVISKNTASKKGGGVYNISGTFTMTEGTIAENRAYKEELTNWRDPVYYGDGGGVCNEGVINMSGGTISNNTAKITGGGICNSKGVFTMGGGEIKGNWAKTGGGVHNGVIFNMNGGTISENTANKYGGGINNDSRASLTMAGGTISKNTSNWAGGGVYNKGTLTMTGGTISENTANSDSGVYNYGIVKVQGTATIDGNDKNDNVRVISSYYSVIVTGEFSGKIKVNSKFGNVAVKADDGYIMTESDISCFEADGSDAYLNFVNNTLVYTKNKTEWGQMTQIKKATYYVDENGRSSTEITGNRKVWLNTKLDGSGSWYCIDNSQGTFKIGSRFYVQVIDDISKYYDKIGSEYRDKIEDGKLKVFLIGVIDPDGNEYTNLDTEINCYVKVDPNWDKDKLKAIFINGEKTEKIDVEYMGTIESPSSGDKFVKLTLKHFSPYAIYQAKDLKENTTINQPVVENSAADESSLEGVPATGENVNYGYILGLSAISMLALAGIVFTKKKFN